MQVMKVSKTCLLEAFMASTEQAFSRVESWKGGGGHVTLKAVITDSWYGDKSNTFVCRTMSDYFLF